MTRIAGLRRMGVVLSMLLLAFNWTEMVHAGDYYDKHGVAIDGYDTVAYFAEQAPVKGSPEFKTEYRSSLFYFSSAANGDAFVAHPDKFAPQYGGYCAFGMAKGY